MSVAVPAGELTNFPIFEAVPAEPPSSPFSDEYDEKTLEEESEPE